MVFFNCNACGEALKKNQVEKHTLRCRSCEVLSCVDCGKDFWGNDYQSHTKCMTEEEKYCGQGYVPKVNKGEAKQEQWIQKVQEAIDKSASNHGLKNLLIKLKDYPNIPRKQQKFQNFLKNSLRINNDYLITQVWNTLMAHSEQDKSKETANNIAPNLKHGINDNGSVGASENKEVEITNSKSISNEEDPKTENVEPKKNKRERKEERQNKANKKEKKDRTETVENGEEPLKKSKKRRHRDDDLEEPTSEEMAATANGTSENQPPKKKKKKKHATEDHGQENEMEENLTAADDQLDCEEPKKNGKFNWEQTITKVLESKGEISLKKLRKKVLNEFAAYGSMNHSEENLWAKFDKKVRKMPSVQVLKDKAKLKESK
ncbi:hypothetical protein EGW08_010840 [Elysia chlorotica]|uniref:Uncharacterized protein n=1 Tax=Elysia chlorotica TaxID=188477 RepID=A0A3S1BIA7_ELYCH|nr:hypothetical protein EGW08_010840 [Elysia chlorotica]